MKKSKISIIIGGGEVGRALYKVLSKNYEVVVLDIDKRKNIGVLPKRFKCDILHICIPFKDFRSFKMVVNDYRDEYKPRHTIIHSTVPVGTSRKLKALHSPVRGIHPELEESLHTFVKYIGGKKASEVADYFRRAGIKVYLFDKQETTEMMKILSTTKYGIDIEFTKEVKRLSDKYNVPFEAWTIWTNDYNEGYKKLGHPEYTRPNLVPIMKEIGGHCVRQNAEFIKNKFTKLL